MSGDRGLWVRRLRAAAEATLGTSPVVPEPGVEGSGGGFRDERGNRLAVDDALFAALRGGGHRGGSRPSMDADVRLWCGEPVDAVVQPCDGSHEADGGRALVGDWTDQPPGQPLVGMEVWGDRELCALHALWWRARTAAPHDRARWCRRGRQACRWLLANLQPDNATNYPWSVHVWVLLAHEGVHPWGEGGLGHEARLYAEMLLHNCLIGAGGGGEGGGGAPTAPGGRPDRRSAWILWHAARELESW